MEIGLRVPLEGEVVRDGAVVLPARLLVDVVRALPATTSRSSCAPPSRTSSSSRLGDVPHPHAAPRGLPAVPEPTATARRRPGPAFVETVLKVARSASRDETRPVLTGILVSAPASELRMVATDSYRLSVKETKLESRARGRVRGQRAGRALQELPRIVQHEGGRACASRCGEPGRVRGRGVVLSRRG
jgi:DNA polymerase-3 subunit beta